MRLSQGLNNSDCVYQLGRTVNKKANGLEQITVFWFWSVTVEM